MFERVVIEANLGPLSILSIQVLFMCGCSSLFVCFKRPQKQRRSIILKTRKMLEINQNNKIISPKVTRIREDSLCIKQTDSPTIGSLSTTATTSTTRKTIDRYRASRCGK